jgi:hypothetical protein
MTKLLWLLEPMPMRSSIQRAGAGGQQTHAQIRIEPAMLCFIGRQPFRQERSQARAAWLESGKPDRFEDGQKLLRIILGRSAQPQIAAHSRRHFSLNSQVYGTDNLP